MYDACVVQERRVQQVGTSTLPGMWMLVDVRAQEEGKTGRVHSQHQQIEEETRTFDDIHSLFGTSSIWWATLN